MTRLLAIFAGANLYLRSWSHHFVTFDRWLVIFTPFVCVLLWAGATETWIGTVITTAVTALWVLFASAALRHNVIFSEGSEGILNASKQETAQLFISGRIALWEGERSRFERLMDRLISGRKPVCWCVRLPTELFIDREQPDFFSLTTHFDPSMRIFGIALENKHGMWTTTGQTQTLRVSEMGKLHLGWRSEDAVRIKFRDPRGKRRWAVISSPEGDAVVAFRDLLLGLSQCRNEEQRDHVSRLAISTNASQTFLASIKNTIEISGD